MKNNVLLTLFVLGFLITMSAVSTETLALLDMIYYGLLGMALSALSLTLMPRLEDWK